MINADKGTFGQCHQRGLYYSQLSYYNITNSNGLLSHFLVIIARQVDIFGANTVMKNSVLLFPIIQQPIILLKCIQTRTERLDSELTQTFEEVWRIGRYDEAIGVMQRSLDCRSGA